MKTYTVELNAKSGKCPLTGRMLPALSETLSISADNEQNAMMQAFARMTIRPMGQEIVVMIDGNEYRDARH